MHHSRSHVKPVGPIDHGSCLGISHPAQPATGKICTFSITKSPCPGREEGFVTGPPNVSTNISRTKSKNLSTSSMLLMAPKLTRTIPVGLPPRMSKSSPHRMPSEKLRLISHACRSQNEAMPPGLHTPPVRRWISCMIARRSTSDFPIQPPWALMKLRARVGPWVLALPYWDVGSL